MRLRPIAVVFLAFCIQPVAAAAYEEETRVLAQKIAASLATAGRKHIAVVDFTDLDGNPTVLGRFLAEEVSVRLLAEARSFEVIDRAHLGALLKEHKLAATGLIDPQTAKRLGEIAGADALATGTMTPFADSVRVAVKVIDVATARLVAGDTVQIPRTQTINDLLARGTGLNGAEVGRETRSTVPTGGYVKSIQGGHFQLKLAECRKVGEAATCTGTVTNSTAQRQRFFFTNMFNQIHVIDDLGNQSRETQLTFGSFGDSQVLEPDTPIRFTLVARGVAGDATSATVVFTCQTGPPDQAIAGGPKETVAFKGVTLK